MNTALLHLLGSLSIILLWGQGGKYGAHAIFVFGDIGLASLASRSMRGFF